jgi:hypothetical protein
MFLVIMPYSLTLSVSSQVSCSWTEGRGCTDLKVFNYSECFSVLMNTNLCFACLGLYINSQIHWQYSRLVTGTGLTQSEGGLPTLMLAW